MEKARANGALVIQKPQKVNQTMFAFVQDHDGYKFKLIQRISFADPLVQVMLHVEDLNRSLNFYTKVTFFATPNYRDRVLLTHLFVRQNLALKFFLVT